LVIHEISTDPIPPLVAFTSKSALTPFQRCLIPDDREDPTNNLTLGAVLKRCRP
jgi:hypothetical protein